MKTVFIDWNLIPYAEAWQQQTEWFDGIVRAKAEGEPYENHIIMCEHPHVYTLGRSGKENNMLLSEEQLKAIDATLYHIDRGGDITYHGPGQLVCYPILNLEEFRLGLKEYVHLLEEADDQGRFLRLGKFVGPIFPEPVSSLLSRKALLAALRLAQDVFCRFQIVFQHTSTFLS